MGSTRTNATKVPSRTALRIEQVIAAATVGIPLLGVPLALANGIPTAFDLALFVGFYTFSMLGITVGFHRLVSHRSFDAHPWLRGALAIAGSTAWQGPPIRWAADHRRHHKHSVSDLDPHSPIAPRAGWSGAMHAYAGWFFASEKTRAHTFVPDLLRDSTLRWVDARYPLWALGGLVAPMGIAALAGSSLLGAFVWGGLLRVAAVQHATWLRNVGCHRWGARPYQTRDESRNNGFINLLVFGEGWHNNHHAFPTSARQGLAPSEVDLSFQLIRMFRALGWVRSYRLPSAAMQHRRRDGRQTDHA